MGKMHGDDDIIGDAEFASELAKIKEKKYTFIKIEGNKCDLDLTDIDKAQLDKFCEDIIDNFTEVFYYQLDESTINYLYSAKSYDDKGKEYYLRLSTDIKNSLNLKNIDLEYIFLYLGKRNITQMTSGVTIYFDNLNNDDCIKIRNNLENNLYIKNPDISGGRRKRKTIKRAKMQKTKRHKHVNRRKSKKNISK